MWYNCGGEQELLGGGGGGTSSPAPRAVAEVEIAENGDSGDTRHGATLLLAPAALHANIMGPHDTKDPLFSLICLDPGSGREIPAIWHCAGKSRHFYPRNLVLRMANFVSRV